MGYICFIKVYQLISISIWIAILVTLFSSSITAKSFCPPLKAPSNTNLTCELPQDKQQINCSSSWLPNGTIAYFQCIVENGNIRKGRIKCNGDKNLSEIELKSKESETDNCDDSDSLLPCDLYEDLTAPQIHLYGYKKPQHYSMLPMTASEDFRQVGLFLHNSLRQRHKSNQLELDENLNQKAQKWAEHLVRQGTLDMASEPTLGQNVFSSDINNRSLVTSDAVQHWYYGGLANYNWTNVKANWDDPLTLDFSQVIWKSTRKLGLGAASRENEQGTSTIIVAFYFPMGNIVLEDTDLPEKLFIDNVLPL